MTDWLAARWNSNSAQLPNVHNMQLLKWSPDGSVYTAIGRREAIMNNPTNRLAYVLFQQACGSLSSEAIKSS